MSIKPSAENDHFENGKFTAWGKIDDIAKIIKSRIIIFQCPSSFILNKENKNNIIKFFDSINRRKYIFVWEPRGDWTPKEIKNICGKLNLVHCVDPFNNKSVYGEIRYYRLHGIGGYNYKYKNEDFDYLKKVITRTLGMDTYIMFNNMNMHKDAIKFKKILDIKTLF